VITVHRLNGDTIGVNADHIERIEEMPDTVLTLLDGKKILVKEALIEVIDLVIDYRASIVRRSTEPPRIETNLTLVHGKQSEPIGITSLSRHEQEIS
jgi:flagellar protein FlbD